ncbi:hypothetical protein MASR2M66_21210 [Chloroflexota bacterium]
MFTMTVAAGKVWRFLNNAAVQLGDIQRLSGNILVAFDTAICHDGAFPGRGMTGAAFGDFSMRRDTADAFAGLGIQSARVKHVTSVSEGGNRQNQ